MAKPIPAYIKEGAPLEAPKVQNLETYSPTRKMVMDKLGEIPSGSRPRALANAIGKDHATTHKALQQLIKMGFVERIPLTYRVTKSALKYKAENGDWATGVLAMPYGLCANLPPVDENDYK